MKKPMLGILAICILQIGFVAYNAIELPFDSASVPSVGVIAPTLASTDAPESEIVVFRSTTAVSAPLPTKRPRIANLITAKRSSKFERPDPARPLPMLAAKKRVRPKVRTEYPIAPLGNGAFSDYSASTPPKSTKKKGFFGKVFPIIKKPYDWAKAFAGKLQ